jgi:hypothetical protein
MTASSLRSLNRIARGRRFVAWLEDKIGVHLFDHKWGSRMLFKWRVVAYLALRSYGLAWGEISRLTGRHRTNMRHACGRAPEELAVLAIQARSEFEKENAEARHAVSA